MSAEENCSDCNIQYNTFYMIRHLQKHFVKKEWIVACKNVYKIKSNKIDYNYGGR